MMITNYSDKNDKAQLALSKITGKQPKRLTVFLLENQSALTHEIASELAIGNISSAAHDANIELEKQGLRIVAKLPFPRILNRFGDTSQSHEWALQVLR